MGVFVSYSNRDSDAVKSLIEFLRDDAEETVWLDERIGGGERWWHLILDQIRGCEVFIFALSQNAMQSKPCQAELQYARDLGLPLLPIQVGPVESPRLHPFAHDQVIDYSSPTPRTAARLVKALHRQRGQRRELPSPLPEEPPVPFAYLMRLSDKIAGSAQLSPSEQAALMGELKWRLSEDGEDDVARKDITLLISRLCSRPDTTYMIRTELGGILGLTEPPTPEKRQAEIRRKVAVAMPFGTTRTERRKAILNFSRLKYIVENKCQVIPTGSSTRVAYDVAVVRTRVDEIPRRALEQIRYADILLALLSEHNQTVAYELGYRRAAGERNPPVILMVDSEDDVRPVYEKSVAYLDWKQEEVLEEIDHIASKDFPPLGDFQIDIPPSLKQVIDAKDDELIIGLQLDLQEIENDFVVPLPDPVQNLRGILLSDAVTRFNPCLLVEVRFSKRGELEDPEAPVKVVDFDAEFSLLYGYADKRAAALDTPLTLDRLLNRINRFSDTDDWNKFLHEQAMLTETVIKNYGFARATVPLRINSSHPQHQFKGKSFLPSMAARVIDGKFDGPHQMYLLIEYIELPNGTAHLSTRGEG